MEQTAQHTPPLTVTLVQCEETLKGRLKKGALWGAASQENQDGGVPVKFVPGSCLHGWNSARVCRTSEINQHIRAANPTSIPFSIQTSDETASLTAEGRLGCWQIAPGGAGRNLNLSLPVEECTLQESGNEPLRLQKLTAIVQIDLSSLPWEGMEKPRTPAVSILSISGGEKRRLRTAAWLELALADWCREHLDTLVSFLSDIESLPAVQTRYACLESFDSSADMIGVLSAENSSCLSGLQHILPVEPADTILVNQDSPSGEALLQTLPVFQRFSAGGLEAVNGEFRAKEPCPLLPADENGPSLTINSLLIRTQPHLHVEMDVSLSLPSGGTVHLVIHSSFEAVFSGGEVRFRAGASSTLSHYAEIPGGKLPEDQQQEIAQAVEYLTARVLY